MDNTVSDRVFTQDKRKQSETGRNKSAVTDHVCQTNHLIDWDSARMVEREMVERIHIRSLPYLISDKV